MDSTRPDQHFFYFWKRPGWRLLSYFCSEKRPGGAILELFYGTPRGAFTPFFTVLGLFEAHLPLWSTDASSFVFSGQRRIIALKLDFTYEEHLCAVALTGSARGAQTHPLASNFLVQSSIALRLFSGEYRCFVLSGLCRRYLRWWSSLSACFNP